MKSEIQNFFRGEIFDDPKTLEQYSHDASLFEVKPKLVVWPMDAKDLENLVKWVGENKYKDQTLSLTVRAAGSDMSGGPLNESIIADVTKHMNDMGDPEVNPSDYNGAGDVVTQPGVFYRDFEKKTLEKGLILPCFPASKNMCALGGQIGNNGAGEKTLKYGKMEDYVLESKVIFSDGNEYLVKPLNQRELEEKISKNSFEGQVYKWLFELIKNNEEIINKAKPRVSKNSAGYYLWNVWKDGIFDLNKLIVGSQGTLGIVTEAKIKLVPVEPVSRLGVIFLKDLKPMAKLVEEILKTKPETLESFDKPSMLLAMRYLPKYLFRFIPEGLIILTHGFPELVLLVEYTGETESEVEKKLEELRSIVKKYKLPFRAPKSKQENEKYWSIRRESFNLLRSRVKGKRTAPFVDDVIVSPEVMPEFLPKMEAIMKKYGMETTIAGHAGNGNFHIIPLMPLHTKQEVETIKKCAEEVYDLVGSYHGSITAEHNDGIIRTPFLNRMYSPEVLELFNKTKEIFDPQDILNPGKKVGITEEYMLEHVNIK